MRSRATRGWQIRRWATALVAVLAMSFPLRSAEPPAADLVETPSPTPVAVEALIANRLLDEAAERLRFVDESQGSDDWTRTLAMLASRYQQQGDASASAEYFARAVVASLNPSASGIATDKKCLLRLAAASALLKVDRGDVAFNAIVWNLDNDPDGPRVAAAAKLLLQIGSRSLAAGDHATAARAYEAALPKLSDVDRPAAELGHAWSLAMGRIEPAMAADQLASFALKYPQHPDASQAIEACLSTLSPALDATDVHDKVTRWLRERIDARETTGITSRVYLIGLLGSQTDDDESFWKACAIGLATTDASGHVTTEALERLSQASDFARAEHFATLIISPHETMAVTAGAREAACRWAGRAQRWSMLAMAADHESIATDDPSRSLGVERLLAEGLMQVGRPEDARVWWEHLIDSRGAADFATLLRCAETSVSHGDVQAARERIEAASAASGDDPFRETLVKMLGADLAIRQLNFDLARSLLESVVRAPVEVGTLRPRAQWLIGETYYMQQRFAESVEAYRTVEGIDPESTWVAASLVQAGKAFEQLGRTRDAAVCYSTLLHRHAESPLAVDARRRLAALEPTAETTIRR